MSTQKQLSFNYQASYYTAGLPEANHLWFVLHGYGQLARYFIRKFDFLETDSYIIAPEGLAHFYLSGTAGRVGASWMTKEQRTSAIHNYISYLNTVYQAEINNRSNLPVHVTMLGFSQGASTLIRWLVNSKVPFDRMIICAGSFPKDVDPSVTDKVFKNKDCYYLYGDQDKYIQWGSLESLKEIFLEYGLKVNFKQFAGKHEVNVECLKEIVQKNR